MSAPRTPGEAQERGFKVDRHCYPWVAYKGPRFRPTEHHRILTDTEADLLDVLRETTGVLTKLYRGESVAGTVLDAIDSAQASIRGAEVRL